MGIVEADYTWTGSRFESGIQISLARTAGSRSSARSAGPPTGA